MKESRNIRKWIQWGSLIAQKKVKPLDFQWLEDLGRLKTPTSAEAYTKPSLDVIFAILDLSMGDVIANADAMISLLEWGKERAYAEIKNAVLLKQQPKPTLKTKLLVWKIRLQYWWKGLHK